MTGVQMKLATFPGDWPAEHGLFGVDYWLDSTGHWTNPQNAVTGSLLGTIIFGSREQTVSWEWTPSTARSASFWSGVGAAERPAALQHRRFGGAPDRIGNGFVRGEPHCQRLPSIDSGQTCYTNAINLVLQPERRSIPVCSLRCFRRQCSRDGGRR